MKIRIYPKKAVIMAQLQARYDELEGDLAKAEERLAKMQASVLFVADQDLRQATDNVDVLSADMNDLGRTMATLASHDPPDVMAEFEI